MDQLEGAGIRDLGQEQDMIWDWKGNRTFPGNACNSSFEHANFCLNNEDDISHNIHHLCGGHS